MSWSATLTLPCKCGAQVSIVIQCDDDPGELRTVPVICWKCFSGIGKVPAVAVWTGPDMKQAAADRLAAMNSKLVDCEDKLRH